MSRGTGRGPAAFDVFPSLAIYWLVALLPDFQARQPQIDLRIRTSATLDRFDRDEIDVAISIGTCDEPRTMRMAMSFEENIVGDHQEYCIVYCQPDEDVPGIRALGAWLLSRFD